MFEKQTCISLVSLLALQTVSLATLCECIAFCRTALMHWVATRFPLVIFSLMLKFRDLWAFPISFRMMAIHNLFRRMFSWSVVNGFSPFSRFFFDWDVVITFEKLWSSMNRESLLKSSNSGFETFFFFIFGVLAFAGSGSFSPLSISWK